MTTAAEPIQPAPPLADSSYAFQSTFWNVLTSPIATFEELADPLRANIERSLLFGSFLVVSLASLIASQAHYVARAETPQVADVTIALIGDLALWYSIAWLTTTLSSWRSAPVEIKRALVLSGWAFLPLIFTGPCALFCRASSAWDFLLPLISFWFVYLELAVFKVLLNLGRGRTLLLLIVLPPVFFMVYIFWILFGSVLVLSSLIKLLPLHTS